MTGAEPGAEAAREELAYTLGVQAWIYGYPLVEMYRVRHRSVYDPDNHVRTPINSFRHRREMLDHRSVTVVAPNNDTIYSWAWLDLAQGPMLLEVPDTGGRYYVMQFLDFYTNAFAYVGKRATGTAAGLFAIVGPGWNGELPAGARRIDAPTPQIWILVRTLVDGAQDVPAVHALQDRYRLRPLSDAASAPEPPPPYDPREPLRFFEYLDVALRANPPPADERGLLALFAPLRIGTGLHVDALDAATARGLRRALEAAPALIMALPSGRPVVNGWLAFSPHTGRFGKDFLYRAYIAKVALAANDPAEALNFSTRRDGLGRLLHGSRRYRLHFAPGQLPPVDGFWSLTMYGMPEGMLVDNPIRRYAVGDRSRHLRYAADGSLDILVQHGEPDAAEQDNWLPAPAGDFDLTLRCYLPQAALIEGRWEPPAVQALE